MIISYEYYKDFNDYEIEVFNQLNTQVNRFEIRESIEVILLKQIFII